MTCCYWLSCAIRMRIKSSYFSKVLGIIWSYGNTGYKVSNSGIQNTSPHPLLQDEIGFQSLFSVIVFTILIDFKPLTVHSSSVNTKFFDLQCCGRHKSPCPDLTTQYTPARILLISELKYLNYHLWVKNDGEKCSRIFYL